MENRALGLIEVYGYLGAIATADATLKAADVELVNAEKISGGLTTIQVMGDVGAVTAGVESGRVVAESLGCLLSSHVIARMDADTQALLIEKKQVKQTVETVPEKKTTASSMTKLQQLEKMKVDQLRKLALEKQVKAIEKGDIKFANKAKLVKALLDHSESGDNE